MYDFTPLPPPAEPEGISYSPWSLDPTYGPPSWPPAPTGKPSHFRNPFLVGFFALVLLASGATTWTLTRSTATLPTPATAILPAPTLPLIPNPGITPITPVPTILPTLTLPTTTITSLDASIVDITGNDAAGNGGVAGTGMIITSSGEVLTNNHVIEGIVDITAKIDGKGHAYNVKVIGYDSSNDVALVQLVGAKNLPVIPLQNPPQLSDGSPLVILGNALGKGGTPAEVSGAIAGLDQTITAADDNGLQENLTGMIEVAANIQPGDSGGPEVNASGQVIGMTTAGSTNTTIPQSATTGYAIPIDKAMTIITNIRTDQTSTVHLGNAAFLGVTVASPSAAGAPISAVQAKTPAAKVGIVKGDLITALATQPITSPDSLLITMRTLTPGQKVSITWVSSTGQPHQATITLGAAPFAD